MPEAEISRRSLFRAGLALGAAGGLLPVVSACGGFSTSGGGGEGQLQFLSTQFRPVEEAERFREILQAAGVEANYLPQEDGPFVTRVRAEQEAGKVTVSLLGGLYGNFAPIAGHLEDLSGLMSRLSDAGFTDDMLDLAKLGTDKTHFIPWVQASYVIAVNKKALDHLPSGADAEKLTWEQYLAWAKAARKANGKPVFGLPAGPDGLFHRCLQGYLYPSFTGGMISAFRGDDAVGMWEFLRELWDATVPASTNFEFMQEPLASGQVQVAWDHVARLVDAPKNAPDDYIMVPAPAGPKGLGYMTVLGGLAIPKGAPEREKAEQAIEALSKPEVQLDVLDKNAFFPAVKAEIPDDLSPGVQLAADAMEAQAAADNAIISLPPVGLGERDGEMSAAFRNAFTSIVLKKEDIRKTLDTQATVIQGLLDDTKAPCWKPDPAGSPCKVG